MSFKSLFPFQLIRQTATFAPDRTLGRLQPLRAFYQSAQRIGACAKRMARFVALREAHTISFSKPILAHLFSLLLSALGLLATLCAISLWPGAMVSEDRFHQ
jgi:hypothetical protein